MTWELLAEIWHRATSVQPAPSSVTVAAAAAVAAAVVLWPPVWRVVRHAVTLVHEAGHAGVAVLTGRRVAGIRLHSDTSGLTTSVGRPRGPGMVLTAAAGYLAPAALGLVAAWATAQGRGVGLLWGLLVVVVVLGVSVRNLFGVWSVLVTAAALVAVTWWAPTAWQNAVACTVGWVLLLGAPRTVLELARTRRRGARTSDADVLARLTHVPAVLWVAVFALATLGAAVLGAVTLWTATAVP